MREGGVRGGGVRGAGCEGLGCERVGCEGVPWRLAHLSQICSSSTLTATYSPNGDSGTATSMSGWLSSG